MFLHLIACYVNINMYYCLNLHSMHLDEALNFFTHLSWTQVHVFLSWKCS